MNRSLQLFVFILLTCFLQACGGGGGGDKSPNSNSVAKTSAISSSVSTTSSISVGSVASSLLSTSSVAVSSSSSILFATSSTSLSSAMSSVDSSLPVSSSSSNSVSKVRVKVVQIGSSGSAGAGIYVIAGALGVGVYPYIGYKPVASGCGGKLISFGDESYMYTIDTKVDCTATIDFVEDTSSQVADRFRKPGNYPAIPGCAPFEGNADAPLKVIFVNLASSPNFEAMVDQAVNQQFKTLSPYKKYISNYAFYKVALDGDFNCQGVGNNLSGSGFSCDSALVNKGLMDKCNITNQDLAAVIKVAIASSEYGGTGGEVIYVGDHSDWTPEMNMMAVQNVIIHEVSHNYGLADLYGGGCRFDGTSPESWSASMARQFLNVDGPGCAKWCKSFKPVSEYKSPCLGFKTKNECLAYNRDERGMCSADLLDEGHYDSCVWDENSTNDYFGSQCLPTSGSQNIGVDCIEGAGCYSGATYGLISWRPVKNRDEDIMYSTNATKFSSVSERELDKAMQCCGTSQDASAECVSYRKQYANFMNVSNFKHAVGSCQILKTQYP